MSKPAVEAHGLRKAFGEVQALDGLSLAVPAGSVLGLLGPNGSGKTTHRVHPGHLAAPRRRPRMRRRAGRGDTGGASTPRYRPGGPVRGRGSQLDRAGEPRSHRAAVPGGPQASPGPVRSATGSGELTGMLRALDGRAPDPVSVAVREPTLDDVFLSYPWRRSSMSTIAIARARSRPPRRGGVRRNRPRALGHGRRRLAQLADPAAHPAGGARGVPARLHLRRLRAGHRHARLAAGVRYPSASRRPGQRRTRADPRRPGST